MMRSPHLRLVVAVTTIAGVLVAAAFFGSYLAAKVAPGLKFKILGPTTLTVGQKATITWDASPENVKKYPYEKIEYCGGKFPKQKCVVLASAAANTGKAVVKVPGSLPLGKGYLKFVPRDAQKKLVTSISTTSSVTVQPANTTTQSNSSSGGGGSGGGSGGGGGGGGGGSSGGGQSPATSTQPVLTATPTPTPTTSASPSSLSQPQCRAHRDNDLDGHVDYNADYPLQGDLSCTSSEDNDETNPKQQCQDAVDNDSDGLLDTADPGCTDTQDTTENTATSQCQDTLDNDSDGAIDYPADVSCAAAQDTDEALPTTACQDGIDNDGDTGVDLGDPGCATPQDTDESNPPQSIVFLDAALHRGDFGGIAAADARCQYIATVIQLPQPTTFRAIMSDSTTDARDHISPAGPIKRPDGVTVATNEADLWDGTINAPINITANREQHPSYFTWTGTSYSGIKEAGLPTMEPYCHDWTDWRPQGAILGNQNKTDSSWVNTGSNGLSCNAKRQLYCIGPNE